MSMGSGAAEGLQQVLQRLFLEAQQKQQLQMHAERLSEDARQADMQQELGQGNLRLGGRRIDQDASELGFRQERAGVDDARYDEAAPSRAANLSFVNAQTENLNREPMEQEAQRTFQTGRDKTQHGYQMQQIGAQGANRQERMVQVMGPQGAPIWTPESQAAGQPAAQAARAVTGQERQSLAYFNRAKQASDDIAPLEQSIAQSGIGSQLQLQHAPNMLQTQQQQAYRQAQRSFTEARLRKESGAAIPTGEYENDAKTYFAQPGDDPKTIEQKRRARNVVLEGLKFSSGKAHDEFYGNTGAAPSAGAAPDSATKAAELLKKYGGGQ